jgi:protein SCO1
MLIFAPVLNHMDRYWIIIGLVLICSCGGKKDPKATVEMPKLPYIGEYEIIERIENGKTVYDTVFTSIPPFSLTNQDGKTITEKDYEGKVYIADFFFTTCPSICPKMTNTLTLVQEKLKDEPRFGILSHTIDPEFDQPGILKAYSEKNKANNEVWNFVTGDREIIYDLCENYYMAYAKRDSLAEGGYIHSGFLILVDKHKFVRAAYDGTRPEVADSIAADVKLLLKEN